MHFSRRPLFAALLLALPAISVHSQQADTDVLEEIIVTANYRETGQDTISERAAQHLEEVLNAVPNVTWAAGASRSRFVQVRGIGDLEQYYDPKYYPSVGMKLDDLELGDSANAGMLFDVEQVEVLRGPQGTRFGASAHAGMVKIRTHAPTDTFEGELSGGVGNYDSYNLGLVLSGPLGEDVKARVAVQQYNSDGYIDNERLNEDDSNDFDELTLRSRLQWAPSDRSHYRIEYLLLRQRQWTGRLVAGERARHLH
jgi:outer membrane receptor protein involved in Fe transport